MAELWLKEFFPYREDNLIDEKNRSLRHMFHRAKLYSWLLARQKDPQSLQGRNLAGMRLTMGLNGYRELGNTLVYALGNAMPEDSLYATCAALDKMREWPPGSGYEESTILRTSVYDIKLQLGFVNRPGEQGNVEKGMVCVFTDLAQAREAQELFRSSHMDFPWWLLHLRSCFLRRCNAPVFWWICRPLVLRFPNRNTPKLTKYESWMPLS